MPRVLARIHGKEATWEEVLQELILLKKGQGLAPRSVSEYEHHAKRFFRLYPDAWPNGLRKAVLEYMAQDIAPSTFNRRREYLGGFFSYCIQEGYLSEDPYRGIKGKKDPGKLRRLQPEDIEKLLDAADTKTYTGLRDKAIILLMMATGIRPGECLQLIPENLNLQTGQVVVPYTIAKTRVERTLPVHPKALQAIKKLLDCRKPSWPKDAPIFCGWDGSPMMETGLAHSFQKLAKKAGVHFTPYMLRHSFAFETLKAGGDPFTIQMMLGHTSMQMTSRYIKLLQSDVTEEMAKHNPLDKLVSTRKRVVKTKR